MTRAGRAAACAAVLLTCAALGGGGPPALAAPAEPQAEPQPVQGGRASATAPTLSAGTYSDQILATDALWYGFDLRAGQTLRAELTVRGGFVQSVTSFSELQFELRGADVMGGLRCDIDAVRELADPGGKILVRERAAQVSGQEVVTGAGLCREPGRYYLRLELADAEDRSRVSEQAQRTGRDPELDVELAVQITPALEETPAAEGSVAPARGGGSSRVAGGVNPPDVAPALLVIGVLGCAVAGLATGAAVAKRVARRA